MATDVLLQKLEKKSGMKVKLKINDNRSTMLSVRWEPDHARVSLHRMFLQAPQNVMQALACYIKGEDKVVSPSIRAFIETNLRQFDYSHTIDQESMVVQGTVYNLQKILDELNAEYFKKQLKLTITWFGKPYPRNKSRVTFGLYHDPLKLIKIHRLLDSPSIPAYVIYYVVYHEMVHHVRPSYFDAKGFHQVHTKEFKELEAKYKHFDAAIKWIEENQINLFAALD